jgi:hypothetical protein
MVFPKACLLTTSATPDAQVSEASRSVREATGPATNVLLAPNVGDINLIDCSKRSLEFPRYRGHLGAAA